ncbi:MAG: amidohydrolase [Burkholderiales bacterium]|nr:amidohydrolase [Burkholderiales bacterium]
MKSQLAIKLGITFSLMLNLSAQAQNVELQKAIAQNYQSQLRPLFEHFHQNPELSFMETNTSARLAKELRAIGYEVTEGVAKTGVVAILKNGPGPLVMLRADMDGLPLEEKSGLPYASRVQQKDGEGKTQFVMHACGHDVHITSLIGTAVQMMARRAQWSGTLMLIGQPAEERVGGALAMMKDQVWQRFGKPDYALAFHVDAGSEAGKITAVEGSPYSGVDTVEITVHGVGTHGAYPHLGKDPVVIAAQIVLALQTIVTREVAPREPAVITVGSFHAGTKSNIISDQAKLQLSVRSENKATRALLLSAIKRVAKHTALAAGLPDSLLPEVVEVDTPTPPTLNDIPLTQRLKKVWAERIGKDAFATDKMRDGMGAEDFPFFTSEPYIPSVYFSIGGTPKEDFDKEKSGGTKVPGHHSPLFKITPEPAIRAGVEASVVALMDLLKK